MASGNSLNFTPIAMYTSRDAVWEAWTFPLELRIVEGVEEPLIGCTLQVWPRHKYTYKPDKILSRKTTRRQNSSSSQSRHWKLLRDIPNLQVRIESAFLTLQLPEATPVVCHNIVKEVYTVNFHSHYTTGSFSFPWATSAIPKPPRLEAPSNPPHLYLLTTPIL